MTTLKIEHGVPVPPPIRRVAKYPFESMDVGDSFSVEPAPEKVAEVGKAKALQQLRASLIRAAKLHTSRRPGIAAVVRKDPLNANAIRCWFVEDAEASEPQDTDQTALGATLEEWDN